MITNLLQPLICPRFRNDARYREGHLRVINALPARKVLGLHAPEMKAVARTLSVTDGAGYIRAFEQEPPQNLCYEETVIWGLLINCSKCSIEARLQMLEKYIPVMDGLCATVFVHRQNGPPVPTSSCCGSGCSVGLPRRASSRCVLQWFSLCVICLNSRGLKRCLPA